MKSKPKIVTSIRVNPDHMQAIIARYGSFSRFVNQCIEVNILSVIPLAKKRKKA